jgi:GcrA cell cycle regulator
MADWSDVQIRKVKTMWRRGATATEIADALGKGFTRGAVLGKIHRLGLKKAEPPKAKARRPAAAKPSAKPRSRVVARPAAKPKSKASSKPSQVRASAPVKPTAARAAASAKLTAARASAPTKPSVARAQPKAEPIVAPASVAAKAILAKTAAKAKAVVVARAPEPSGPMPIWALGQCQCRWPIGNLLDPPGLFCGAVTADGSSWCPVHERMVYTGSARPRSDSSMRDQPRFAATSGRSRF